MTATDSRAVDTIAAVATAPGRGAVGLLRISGPEAAAIAATICGRVPEPRVAGLRRFRDGDGIVIDHGLVLWFPAPNSFTGEAVVELQGHGAPVVLDLLLRAAVRAGARLARPGEFSERAFVNGRLDLAQAESIADLIDAGSQAAVRAASRSLHGEFSQRVGGLVDALIALRADLEAALDFADEDVPWLSSAQMTERLAALDQQLAQLLVSAAQGRRLRDGLVVAIAGQPNVGKSTLLNRLAGTDAAIVSPIPGTTRDVLREHLVLDGLPVTVLDTAGLRETRDEIERIGIERARRAVEQAELLLYLVDDRSGVTADDEALLATLPATVPRRIVHTKCDLSGQPATAVDGVDDEPGARGNLRLSAATGDGIPSLISTLHAAAGLDDTSGDAFGARTRHVDALRQAAAEIAQARTQGLRSPELIAEHLRLAQAALEAITGRYTADDLLGRIFSTFCLGK